VFVKFTPHAPQIEQARNYGIKIAEMLLSKQCNGEG